MLALIGIALGCLTPLGEGSFGGALAWRVTFFGLLGGIAFKAPLLRAWRSGRLHTLWDVERAVPFTTDEFVSSEAFAPGSARYGVRGRGATYGLLLLLGALLVWSGGLAFGALSATGTMALTPGVSSQVVTRDGSGAPYVLGHRHTLLSVTDIEGQQVGADPSAHAELVAGIRVEHPTTRAQADYTLESGGSVLFEGHRVSLVSISPTGISLRFAERWVWWWRIAIVAAATGGFLLVLLVPYRAWLWVGRSGDYRLRAWSFNASHTTATFVDSALRAGLGEQGYSELTDIERSLSSRPAPTPHKRPPRVADPVVGMRLLVVPLAALLGLAHEFIAGIPGTGLPPVAMALATAVVALADFSRL